VKGVFITLEGPEGSGKSTHAALLATALENAGHKVVSVREPGGTATGEAIRDILQHDKGGEPLFPETEALLFAASRAQLVRDVILPALSQGHCVVADRFADSTTAYQGYGRGFGVDRMLSVNAFAIDGAEPDLTVLLDIPVEQGFERIAERNRAEGRKLDRMERESRDFHEKVRQGYLEMAQRWPDRFKMVDSRRSVEAIAADIWPAVQALLPAI
jgi:dTMP kinase